jgi:hypothetical protein
VSSAPLSPQCHTDTDYVCTTQLREL